MWRNMKEIWRIYEGNMKKMLGNMEKYEGKSVGLGKIAGFWPMQWILGKRGGNQERHETWSFLFSLARKFMLYNDHDGPSPHYPTWPLVKNPNEEIILSNERCFKNLLTPPLITVFKYFLEFNMTFMKILQEYFFLVNFVYINFLLTYFCSYLLFFKEKPKIWKHVLYLTQTWCPEGESNTLTGGGLLGICKGTILNVA
mgnify:CR=1 FL=1